MHTLHITVAYIEAGEPKEWSAPVKDLDEDSRFSLPLTLATYNSVLPKGEKIYHVEVRANDATTGTLRIHNRSGVLPSITMTDDGADEVSSTFLHEFHGDFTAALRLLLPAYQQRPAQRDARAV